MLRSRWTQLLLLVVCLVPVAVLGQRYNQNDLTANPIEFITHFTGDWAIRFLVLTLAITPLRRLLRMPDLIRFRRMLGLLAFFYGMLHFLTWFWLDKNADWNEISQDIVKRSFVTAGFTSLFLMLPLAVTSTSGWVRRMGPKRWQALHRLVYVSGIAAVVHYYWLVKSDVRLPLLYGSLTAIFLVARLFGGKKKETSNALRISEVKRETADAVTLRFSLEDRGPLNAKPGQFLTFQWMVDGKTLPRSYSISSSPLRQDYVEVTVKQQGVVSTFINRHAKPGLTVEARGPFGNFCLDVQKHSRVVLFAAGSGATPVLSILRYLAEVAPKTEAIFFYSVRTEKDVIFQADLAALEKSMPNFRCLIFASRPGAGWSGLRGRVDRAAIEQHLDGTAGRTFFLCGPAGYMANIREILLSRGASEEQILQERFFVEAAEPPAGKTGNYSVELVKSGKRFDCAASGLILEAAEKQGIELAYDCRAGQCGTCAVRVIEGEVTMDTSEGLTDDLRAQGYRLICVGRPNSDLRIEA